MFFIQVSLLWICVSAGSAVLIANVTPIPFFWAFPITAVITLIVGWFFFTRETDDVAEQVEE